MVFAVPRRPSSQEGAPGPWDPGFRATREASGCVVLMRVSRCGGMPAVHNERGGGGRCCSTPSSDSSRGLRWRALWCAGVAVWSTSTDDSACRPGSTSAVQLHVSVAATVVSAPYRQPRPDIRLVHGVDRRLCRHGNLSINLWIVYSPHMHRDPVVSCFVSSPFESPPPPPPDAPTPTPCAAHLLLHARDPCRTDMPSPCPGMLSLQCHRHTQRLPVCHGHACVLVATAKDSGGCRLCWWSVCVLGTMGGAWERQEAALGACRASETHEQRPSPAAAQLGWQLEARNSNVMIHYSCAHQTQTQLGNGWCDHTHEVWWSNSQRSFRNHDRRVCQAPRGAP